MAEENHTTNASLGVEEPEFHGTAPGFGSSTVAKRLAFTVRMEAYLVTERRTSLAQIQSFETLQRAIQSQVVAVFRLQEIFRGIQEQDIRNHQQINLILQHASIARQKLIENSHQFADFRKQPVFPTWLQRNKACEQSLRNTYKRIFQMQDESYQIHKDSFVAHLNSIVEQLTSFQAEMASLSSEQEAFNAQIHSMILALRENLLIRLQHASDQPHDLRAMLQEAAMFDLENFLSYQLDTRVKQQVYKNRQYDSMTYRQNAILIEQNFFRTRQLRFQAEQQKFRTRQWDILALLEAHLLATSQLGASMPAAEQQVAGKRKG